MVISFKHPLTSHIKKIKKQKQTREEKNNTRKIQYPVDIFQNELIRVRQSNKQNGT